MKFEKVVEQLKKNGLTYKNLNCVRMHNRNETEKHLLCKLAMCRLLLEKGKWFMTEYEFPNKVTADVFIADDLIAIEFETVGTDEAKEKKLEIYRPLLDEGKVKDLFFFDLRKIPRDYDYQGIKTYFEERGF